jgi:glycosyltransferase involved in cell wall biosynthesis
MPAAPRPEVVIVHRHLTHYRVPLFEALRAKLQSDGIALRLLHGTPRRAEARKRDTGHLDWAEALPLRYWLGERVCWQPFGRQAGGADLVVVTQENALVYNYWALTGGRHAFPRIAFWGHGANLQSRAPGGLRERFKRYWINHVDWWFAYTGMSVELVRRAGFPPGRITDLENAIDTQALDAACRALGGDELEAARREFGLQGARVGLYLGSLYEEKRLPFLIETADRLAQRLPDFRLLVVGDGPQRPLVEQAARSRPWLRYLGARQGRDKALALRLADVVLNPGLVGLGILDAFTAGLPMLTTDCGLHSPEIAYLRQGVNGVMTADSIDAYAAAALALLEDPAARGLLGEQARAAGAHYTIENMAQRFRSGIHAALLSAPRGAGR